MDGPEDTARALYRALESDDIAGFLARCAEDVSVEYPADGQLPYGGSWRGLEGVTAFLEAHDAAEEIVEFIVHRFLGEGSTLAALGHFVGRPKPSGREWSTDFVHVLTIEDGRLSRWVGFFDSAAAVTART